MIQLTQQINLYQNSTGGLTAFTARASLMTLAITGLALLGVWGFGLWQVNSLERNVASLNQLQQQQQSLTIATGNDQTVSTDPAVLSEQLQQLKTLAEMRKRSLDLLRSRLASNATGFSPRLEALARRHLQGVWLDHILLTNSRGVSSIGGGTVSVDLIPQYLQGLARETSLTGTAFNEFRIEGHSANDEESGDKQPLRSDSYRFSATNNPEGQGSDLLQPG